MINIIRRITSCLLAALLCCSIAAYADYYDGVNETAGRPDTSTWYEWEYPDDTAALGTAIDASKFLDAPAGKHGYIHAEGRKMFFEDGTQARFWGTNISMMGNFPTYEETDDLVARIARVGFNLVRLHNFDTVSASCIFGTSGNIDPRNINEEQFDKFCYLIAKLKERGVYIYCDWIAGRNLTDDDPNIQAKKYLTGIRPAQYWDEDLRDMWKDYARQLFTTKNKYTGMSLAEDPVLVAIDLLNEQGNLTYSGGFSENDNYYFAQATSGFNRWLEKKYTTTENLEKAWEQEGKVGLMEGENLIEGTVIFLTDVNKQEPNYMHELNYSEKRIQDWKYYMYDVWRDFNTDMRDYLREELGVKCMITSVGSGGTTNFKAPTPYQNIQEFDYTDAHSYKCHPVGWSLNVGEQISGWSSVLMKGGQEQNRFLWFYGPHDQPFFMGEWQHCYPGIHSSEGNVFQAIFCSRQEWNPIEFCMLGNFPQWTRDNVILNDSFQTYYDAAKTSIQPLAAMLFHHNDIEIPEEEYYFELDYDECEDSRLLLDQNHLLGMNNIYAYAKTGVHYKDASSSDYTPNPEDMERALEKQSTDMYQDDQFYWNMNTGIMTLNTEHSNVAMGYIGEKKMSLSMMDITLDQYYGTTVLTSTSDEPLTTAKQMLLGVVIEARNEGLVLDDDNATTVVSAPSGPMQVKPVSGDVVIKTTDDIAVYALNSSGARIAEVPIERDNNGYAAFYMDGEKYQAVHYEIERK